MADDTDIESALDALYDRIDDRLLAGDFVTVDREIASVDVAATDLTMLLGWLTITYAARERLPARGRFAVSVFGRAEREQGTDKAVELLRGLVDPVDPSRMAIDAPPQETSLQHLRWALVSRRG